MRYVIALILLTSLVSCGGPNPEDVVRKMRREYKIDYDFTVSESNEIRSEVKIQNLVGENGLQELTLDIEAYDAEGNMFWSDRFLYDLTGIAHYASGNQIVAYTVEGAAEKLDGLTIKIAPDNPESDYKTYKEFIRAL